MAKVGPSLYGLRIQIQEQSLEARRAGNRKLAKSLDKLGAKLERAIKGYIAGTDDDFDGSLARLMDGVVGAVIASGDEQLFLWQENEQRDPKRKWETSGGGPIVNIAIIADRHVWVGLSTLTIGGYKLLMVEPTSPIVCYDMVRKWLGIMLPESARSYSRDKDRPLIKDAGQFMSMLSDMEYADKKAAEQEQAA